MMGKREKREAPAMEEMSVRKIIIVMAVMAATMGIGYYLPEGTGPPADVWSKHDPQVGVILV